MGVMEAMGSSRSSWALSIFEILQLFFQDTFHLRSSTVFWNMFKTSKHICTSTIPRRNNKNLQQPYMFPAILTDCPSDPEKSDILQLPSQTFVENIVVAVEPRKHVGSAFAFVNSAAFRWLIGSAAAQHSLQIFSLLSIKGTGLSPAANEATLQPRLCKHMMEKEKGWNKPKQGWTSTSKNGSPKSSTMILSTPKCPGRSNTVISKFSLILSSLQFICKNLNSCARVQN